MGAFKRPPMGKSPKLLVRAALDVGGKVLPPYSHPNSPKKYTQAQLFAILVLREFFGMDYRLTQELLLEWEELREELGIKEVPHYTCLQKAEQRLLKKGASIVSLMQPSLWQSVAV